MKKLWLPLLVVLSGMNLADAEEPPYKRVLQGDDAKKAAALTQRTDELWAAGKFAEAVAPAEEELALRRRLQGEGHWQVADAARQVEGLRKVAALPAEKRAALVQAHDMEGKAEALYGRGKYAEAEPLFRKALAIWEETLGRRHQQTLLLYYNLAINLRRQGRFEEAERLSRKALADCEQVLGPRHPDTARSYNNLASSLDAQGQSKEAEPLFRKALAIQQQVLGGRHPDTADSCMNLAGNLQHLGRAKEAEPLLRQALAAWEEVHGPRHPSTAVGYNNLAMNLDAQGRAPEAEPFHRKALAVFEAVLGPRHPETASSYNNLALNLQEQGRFQDAEPLYRQALAVCEEALGPRHPNTAFCYNNLARNLQAQGRAQEAEPLFRKALATFKEALGPRHPFTAQVYDNLAQSLLDRGRATEAEPLLRQALAIREEVLGPRHPDTAVTYGNLANNLQAQGRFKDAERFLRKGLAICEEVLGPRHTNTGAAYNTLASNLQAQGRLKEAESVLGRNLAVLEEVLGPKHPHTAASYSYLAGNLQAQGRAKEAEALLRRALAVRAEVLGPNHPDTAVGYNNLAYNLQAQGRPGEAETLYRKAVTIGEEVLGAKHPDTVRSYYNLAANLQDQGRSKEAEPLWQKGVAGLEAARLRLASSTLDRAAALRIQPHLGLAVCRARLDRPRDAWTAAEDGLARGLLDDLAARVALPADAEAQRRNTQRAARLDALDRLLTPLLTREQLSEEQRRRRDELLRERSRLDAEAAEMAANASRQAVLPLADVQAALAADTALVFWVDLPQTGDHWGCVVRHGRLPAWVRLKGSGPKGEWVEADDKLPRRLRDDLDHGEPDAYDRARRLAEQRLRPLEPHLAAADQLPAVRHLVVVAAGRMASIPAEALTDRYLISYAPSGTVFARLRQKHRPLESPSLLGLGDPNFALPDAGPPPQPPEHGLYLSLVLPGGNAARAGLRGGDVLLRYGGTKLVTRADLKVAQDGDPMPVVVWRNGQTLDDLRIAPGKLGVVVSEDAPAVALRKRRELDQLTDARSRDGAGPLPGTRFEVAAMAGLLPKDKRTLLIGSKASEQELDELAATGKLKDFRLLHLATHGTVDPVSAAHSALLLARDKLPGPDEQARLAAAGKRVPTGRLSVADIAERWQLDANLVTLSACQTALGPDGGGEGLLGFSQVLLARGARSLVLSLWKVDDTATALLMARFYQNLLGKRDGLKAPLPKAEALHEAKRWLRTLPRAEVEALAGQLAKGSVRADEEPDRPAPPREASRPAVPAGETPFAHPRFWAAFILIGDPE
jgi:tetratricopeptide (TPR) repeat protein